LVSDAARVMRPSDCFAGRKEAALGSPLRPGDAGRDVAADQLPAVQELADHQHPAALISRAVI